MMGTGIDGIHTMADTDTVTVMDLDMDTTHMVTITDIRTSYTEVAGLRRQGIQATVGLAAQHKLEDTRAKSEGQWEARSACLRRAVDLAAKVVDQSHRLRDGARLQRVVRRETTARQRTAADVVLPHRADRLPQAYDQPLPTAEAGALRAARGIVEQAEAGGIRKLLHLATTGRKRVHNGGVQHRLLRALHRLRHTRRLHHRHLLLQARHQALVEATEETGAAVQLAAAGTN